MTSSSSSSSGAANRQRAELSAGGGESAGGSSAEGEHLAYFQRATGVKCEMTARHLIEAALGDPHVAVELFFNAMDQPPNLIQHKRQNGERKPTATASPGPGQKASLEYFIKFRFPNGLLLTGKFCSSATVQELYDFAGNTKVSAKHFGEGKALHLKYFHQGIHVLEDDIKMTIKEAQVFGKVVIVTYT